MTRKRRKNADEIAKEYAQAYYRPSELENGRTIQGDIWYSDIHRAVGKGRMSVYQDVCDKLTAMGYWVHS